MDNREIAPTQSARTRDAYTAVPPAKAEYPSDVCVHQLFELQADRIPDAVAARAGNESLTYRELNFRANQLARYLVAKGVVPRGSVAVLMNRTPACLVSLLAIIKAGAAYVPVDAGLPAKRVDYILTDSGATCVLTDRETRSLLDEPRSASTLVIDVDDPSIYSGETSNLGLAVDPEQQVYCIYTSGSTGLPKGVMVQHRALMNYVWWAKKQYVTDAVESFALYSSLSFDLTVTSIFVPLISGRCIDVYPDLGEDVPVINRVLEDNKVDVVKLTPAHLALLRNTDLSQSRLKVLILGGEDLRAETAGDVHKRLDGRAVIYNEYGPTETVVGCMIHRYDPAVDLHGSVPIGVGIDNMRIYLLDDRRRPVKPGEVGEIYIGGDGVTLGYKDKPQVTADHFISNPFVEGERLYASGDLGRVNERGALVFLGRKDLQIKLRGYRIELGEIESALLSYPGIKECIVDSTKTAQSQAAAQLTYCTKCGLASSFPNTTYSAEGVCNHCEAFDKYRSVVDDYFSTMDELQSIVTEMKSIHNSKYDCIVALSGGKDSTYALCRMIETGARVLAFTLDNGYISEEAKQNINRVVARLGVDHRYLSTGHMKEIFVDSLKRHSNVCNGCFKTIYTFAINLAQEVGVKHVVMGLSKGQLFETRLSALFRTSTFDNAAFEKSLVDARKIYHRIDDAVSRLLDTTCVKNDKVIENIRFVDFYRYCHASRQEMYDYIQERVGWARPIDTGRSTNCLLNDVGIYVHNKERRYHNYSLPYSWDVRMGHISREEAMRELDDSADIDVERVEGIIKDLGYELNDQVVGSAEAQLVAYYVSAEEFPASDLRQFLSEILPEYMVPRSFVQLDSIPLTPNGKVNRQALPKPDLLRKAGTDGQAAPRTPVEKQLAELWKEVLQVDSVGIHDNFFEMGGHSLPALMLLYKIDSQFHKTISIQEFSKVPTISALAAHLGSDTEAVPPGLGEVVDQSAPAYRG
uniref:Non-ribosomal peptide synthase n=1 Tax=Cystobacter sp. Cbv34 TaxID=1679164 RepID=A0A0H4NUD7_9BACT|nr:non-ribosomal peptide synthase [Cystobacter sp. Cbv34]QQZ45547.1 CysH [synthetic construct]